VDDAMHATRAAVEEGIVPGGGVCLIRCEEALDGLKGLSGDERMGVEIVRRALEEPLRQIARNAGEEGAVVVDEVRAAAKDGRGADWGWDAKEGKYGDMMAAGIIDPAKVVRSALQNAASIAGLILTTETLITELKEKKKPAVAAQT
jgi:chaperonin GroEL